MFYSLTGTIKEVGPNYVILDTQGIGFFLNSTLNTLSSIQRGSTATLYISESIGESNFDLYGFFDMREKRFFEQLISVSGVGPKMAISLLSFLTPDQLIFSVINDDAKALTAAPGIGKKIAQRIILELRDKLSAEMPENTSFLPAERASSTIKDDKNISDAMAALTVLGYSSSEIGPIVRKGNWDGMSADQIIKEVLKQMI